MKTQTNCRMCGSTKLKKFLDLGILPLANAFIHEGDHEDRFPLEVCVCTDCWLTQLVYVIEKETLFDDYIYFSSGVPKLSEHFIRYAEDIAEWFLEPGDFVMELGSNDGVLLSWFKERGYKVLGIDPAKNIAKIANERAIPTSAEFFTRDLARSVATDLGKPQVIMANNTVAHIDDYEELFEGIASLLATDGVFVFEAPYLIDMFEHLTYDTIYHEHLSYFTVRPFLNFLKRFGLEIFDVQVIPVQGQSLRIFVGHSGAHKKTRMVNQLVIREKNLKLDRIATYHTLAKVINGSRTKLKNTLADLKKRGKGIAGYGAPAKGSTVLNYCNIGTETLDFIIDDMPSKQGLLTPGTHIPVISREAAPSSDYYLLLAWNYKEAIFKREKDFINKERFILPV